MSTESEDLKTAKIMGGVGTIVRGIGEILVLIGIKKIADIAKRKEIFSHYVTSFVLELLLFPLIFVFQVIASFSKTTGRLEVIHFFIDRVGIVGFILFVIFIPYTMFVIASYFKKKSFVAIANTFGVKSFEEAGNLWFLGSILLIVFGLGAIVLLVAWIYTIIAFFSLPEEVPSIRNTENLPINSN